MLKLLVDNVDT